MGYIRFVVFTNELYDPAYYDKKRLSRQYEWLISDLEVWALLRVHEEQDWLTFLMEYNIYNLSDTPKYTYRRIV